MSYLPRRVTDVFECYLGQGLIFTLPFQTVDASQCLKAKDPLAFMRSIVLALLLSV